MDTTISTYHGWSNRETWLASLWLTNDESLYSQLRAAKRLEQVGSIQAEWLAERVYEQLDWYLEDEEASMWVDIARTAFNRVDWCEVIENN
jgi:hypothetical protein